MSTCLSANEKYDESTNLNNNNFNGEIDESYNNIDELSDY